jgi:DNA-binding IclR family transcriptional regulator
MFAKRDGRGKPIAKRLESAGTNSGGDGRPTDEAVFERIGGVRAVARGLSILRLFGQRRHDADWTLDEISRALELPKSTTHRLLATLTNQGFVERVGATSYRLGVEAAIIGSCAIQNQRPRSEVHELMTRRALDIGETIGLGVLKGRRVVVLERGLPAKPFSWNIGIGTTLPAHASAAGKMLLSGLDTTAVAELFPSDDALEVWGRNTITDRTEFFAELDVIRERGYAVDREELEEGFSCVAAPVRALDDRISHSLGVMAPVSRMSDQRLAEVATFLIELANELARYLRHEHILETF